MLATTISALPVVKHSTAGASLALLEDMVLGLGERTGILHFSSKDSDARICVHKGRIAWVHAGAEGGFLSQRLASMLSMTQAELVEILLRCRREQRHLGELVVGMELLSETQFRTLMLEHNREHLRVMLSGRGDSDAEWSFEDRVESYKSTFTFLISELVGDGWEMPSDPNPVALRDTLRQLGLRAPARAWIKTPQHVVGSLDDSMPTDFDAMLSHIPAATSDGETYEVLATSETAVTAIALLRRDTALVIEYPLLNSRSSALVSTARLLRTLRRGADALKVVLASNEERREPARTPVSSRAGGGSRRLRS